MFQNCNLGHSLYYRKTGNLLRFSFAYFFLHFRNRIEALNDKYETFSFMLIRIGQPTTNVACYHPPGLQPGPRGFHHDFQLTLLYLCTFWPKR